MHPDRAVSYAVAALVLLALLECPQARQLHANIAQHPGQTICMLVMPAAAQSVSLKPSHVVIQTGKHVVAWRTCETECRLYLTVFCSMAR